MATSNQGNWENSLSPFVKSLLFKRNHMVPACCQKPTLSHSHRCSTSKSFLHFHISMQVKQISRWSISGGVGWVRPPFYKLLFPFGSWNLWRWKKSMLFFFLFFFFLLSNIFHHSFLLCLHFLKWVLNLHMASYTFMDYRVSVPAVITGPCKWIDKYYYNYYYY